MELTISNVEPKPRKVKDFDFIFVSGQVMPVTIDEASGDTIEFVDGGVMISLVEKPSSVDPSKILPAEDITIFSSHLISIQKREREVATLTKEQQDSWKQTLDELSGKPYRVN